MKGVVVALLCARTIPRKALRYGAFYTLHSLIQDWDKKQIPLPFVPISLIFHRKGEDIKLQEVLNIIKLLQFSKTLSWYIIELNV